MQKLLKRTAQAEKQVARRKALRKSIEKGVRERGVFNKRMAAVQDANRLLINARQRQRQDYEMGPLAPRRDTHIRDPSGTFWGTVSLARSNVELGEKQRELACKWAGGLQHLCIKPGDRVAIMEGPDKSKIGIVREIVLEDGTVSLEGAHLDQNTTLSEILASAKLTKDYTQLATLQVPIQSIRLVHPLRDPETGKVRDAVITELQPRNIIRDKPTGRVSWSRVIPGLNVEIPWPHRFELAERKRLEEVMADNDCDTPRIDVGEQTFVPSLLRPPMPVEVIDELRNRYSKFRTRHEPEYIARKEEQAAVKVAARKKAMAMQTPLQELHAKTREEKKARGQPVLSDAMLEKIGEFMVRAQQARNGVPTKVTSTDPGAKEGKTSDGMRIEVKAEQTSTKKTKSQKTAQADRFQFMSKKGKAKYLAKLEAGAKAKAAEAPAPSLPALESAPETTAPPPS